MRTKTSEELLRAFKKKTPFDLINYIVNYICKKMHIRGRVLKQKTVSREIVKWCLYQQLLYIGNRRALKLYCDIRV